MKKIILALSLSFILSATAWAGDTAKTFQRILDDHWNMTLEENPVFGSRLGLRQYDGRLGENTEAARNRRKAYNDNTLKRLSQIKVSELDGDALLNYKIFKRQRVMEQEASNHPGYLFAITNRSGCSSLFWTR